MNINIGPATIRRDCDICGNSFEAKNAQAAFMMAAGKLRVCADCQRAGARTKLTYREYIQSDAWKIRRQRALRLAEQKCQVCGSQDRLETHHNTYERLGHERDSDLVVLCHNCHTLFHDDGRLPY